MKRVLAQLAGALVISLVAMPALSQSSQSGTVLRIHVRGSDGLIYFYVNGPRSAAPGCATQSYWIIPNETSTAAKQQLVMLLMAEATGKGVTIYGSGTCTRWPDGENVVEVAVSD